MAELDKKSGPSTAAHEVYEKGDAHVAGSSIPELYDPSKESVWTRLGLTAESFKRAPGTTGYVHPHIITPLSVRPVAPSFLTELILQRAGHLRRGRDPDRHKEAPRQPNVAAEDEAPPPSTFPDPYGHHPSSRLLDPPLALIPLSYLRFGTSLNISRSDTYVFAFHSK